MFKKTLVALVLVVVALFAGTLFPATSVSAENCEVNPNHKKCQEGQDNVEKKDKTDHPKWERLTPGWFHHFTGNGTCKEAYKHNGQKPNAEWQSGRCPQEEITNEEKSSTSKQVAVKTVTEEEIEVSPVVCEQCVSIVIPIKKSGDVDEALLILARLEEKGYYCPSCVEVVITTSTLKDLDWALPALQKLEAAGYYCSLTTQ